MLQRVEFNWLGLNGEEHVQPLEALDDVADYVLAELEHETETDTTWTYYQRISFAVERMDKRLRLEDRNHDVYEDWVC